MGVYEDKRGWMWTCENGDHTRGCFHADWDGKCRKHSNKAFDSRERAEAALKRHVNNTCKYNYYPYNRENS